MISCTWGLQRNIYVYVYGFIQYRLALITAGLTVSKRPKLLLSNKSNLSTQYITGVRVQKIWKRENAPNNQISHANEWLCSNPRAEHLVGCVKYRGHMVYWPPNGLQDNKDRKIAFGKWNITLSIDPVACTPTKLPDLFITSPCLRIR